MLREVFAVVKEKRFFAVFAVIFFAVFLFLPKQKTAFAEETLISDLYISITQITQDTVNPEDVLLKSTDFSPEQASYDLGEISDSRLSIFGGGYKLYYGFSAAEGVSVTVLHYPSAGVLTEKDVTSASNKWSSALVGGKNTITVKATKGETTKTYSFSVNVAPSLESLALSTGSSEIHLSPEFSAEVYEYSAELSDAVSAVSVSAKPTDSGSTVLYNGAAESSVSVSAETEKITVEVTGGTGENAVSKEYIIDLNKKPAEKAVFETVPADATVILYDSKGGRIYPDSFGGKTFTGIFGEGGCTYTVSKSGYAAKSGTVLAGTTKVTLEKAGTALKNLSAEWKNFRNSDYNMAITSAQTPSADKAQLLWSASFGSGWDKTVGLPLIVDGSVYVMYGSKIAKLDKATGKETASAELAGEFNWGYTPMSYAEGMLFVPLDEGTIQALNAETLESLWVYKDPLKGQSLCPITYSEGYIYTGFWNGETKDANFVCLSVTDEEPANKTENKTPVWKVTQKGGYYWAGAVVVGNAVIFGSDDGETNFDGENAVLCSLNKYTGEVISRFRITGDQRSSIAYSAETGRIYFTTKCGYLYSAAVNLSTGVLTELKYVDYGAQSTSTPVYYKGRLYFGTGSGISTSGSSGEFVCADAVSLKKIYSAALVGYPQCSFLLSTAYESSAGKIYFYSSYNSLPGGVARIETTAEGSSATVKYIYEPASSQYCICSLICDSDGNIYYKNDSGTLFAVKGGSSGSTSSGDSTAVSEEEIITKIKAAKPGETVTMSIPNMETTVSRRVFIALMGMENVTLKLAGPHFYWYFNSEDVTEPEEYYFSPWVTVSSRRTIANGYFPDKKVLAVIFAEKYEIPGRAMLMIPRLSPYFESEALANSSGAALYEYTRESKTDANARFAYDSEWFAITVTELKDYLITEAEGTAATAPQSQSAAAGSDKPVIPETPPDEEPEEAPEEITESESLNAEQYNEMAEALKTSVGNLRTLDSALTALNEKYNSDMTLMAAVSAAGMLVVAAAAGTVIYLIMKRKIKNTAEAER